MIQHAQRLVANAITEALRHPWKIDAFDRKGNAAGMTSPFRLTANPPRKPPSLFMERFHWGVVDPDAALGTPAMAWLLREHAMLAALATFTVAEQTEWREHLQGGDQTFTRMCNRHGTLKLRRNARVTNDAARVALAVAAASRVAIVPLAEYRETYPVQLFEHNPTNNRAPQLTTALPVP